MAATFKKGAPVKVTCSRTKRTLDGKFVTTRSTSGRGDFCDVEIEGKVKSYRPSQVAPA